MAENIVSINAAKSGESPFDRIRRTDENGEYWVARELMSLLGYTQWRQFNDCIDIAIENLDINGDEASKHFLRLTAKSRGRDAKDYKLSRYACYHVALACDGRKPAVAAAKKYFVVKTREAEVKPPIAPSTQPLELPPADVRVNNLINALQWIGIEPDNPRWAQGLRDLTLNILGIDQYSLPSADRWLGVVEIAEDMGFKQAASLKVRSALGRYISAKCDSVKIKRKKERRLCNGTDREIWVYLDTPELRNAIQGYFDPPITA